MGREDVIRELGIRASRKDLPENARAGECIIPGAGIAARPVSSGSAG